MFQSDAVVELHRETVVRWHDQPIDNQYDGILHVVCQQHSYNFLLWHEEDLARSPTASDARIAQVKRRIDGLNQQRNDWIERIYDWISRLLNNAAISAADNTPLNTETPGSVIDRLSILALSLYHLD
jgi:hypothetical protein